MPKKTPPEETKVPAEIPFPKSLEPGTLSISRDDLRSLIDLAHDIARNLNIFSGDVVNLINDYHHHKVDELAFGLKLAEYLYIHFNDQDKVQSLRDKLLQIYQTAESLS